MHTLTPFDRFINAICALDNRPLPFGQNEPLPDMATLRSMCESLQSDDAAFISRGGKGRWTLKKKTLRKKGLGTIQWRTGEDKKTKLPYLALWVNGNMVLECRGTFKH